MHFVRGSVRNKKRTDLTSSYPLLRAAIEIWFPSLIIAHPCNFGKATISINHCLRHSLLNRSNFQLLPSVIKTLCSLIVRFKSIRSFAGAQVRLSLVMDSLRRMRWSIGRSRSTVHKAAAPMAINACVLGIGRHR